MKKVITLALAAGSALLLASGCLSATNNTIREYDAAGALIRETVTSESVVKTLTDATAGKVVYVNDQSWLAGVIFVPPASNIENAAGAAKILAGKNDRQYITIPPGAGKDTKYLPAIIQAARAGEISVSTTGVTSTTTDKTE